VQGKAIFCGFAKATIEALGKAYKKSLSLTSYSGTREQRFKKKRDVIASKIITPQ
jgi:hypothetical protein